MFLPALRAELSQGDILQGISVQDSAREPREAIVCVLSHDCEIDKPGDRSRFLLVVEIRSPADAGSSNWGNIRSNQAWNALYLPAGQETPEGYLDLGRIYRVEKSILESAMASGRRIASMSDDGREAVIYALTSFFLHEDIAPPE
jgi:hypothetical protein